MQAMDDGVKQQVELTLRACDRVRKFLLVAVIGSVIVFTSDWNTYVGRWLRGDMDIVFARAKAAIQKAEQTAIPNRNLNAEVDLDAVFHLNKALYDAQYVKVPLFDVAVHVNDIGILGGLGLSITMLLLLFSLVRQRENFVLTLERVRPDPKALREVYCLLFMGQVLTLPPWSEKWRDAVPLRRSRVWLPLRIMLYLLPSAALLFLFEMDGKSLSNLQLSTLHAAMPHFLVNAFVLVVELYLTFQCLMQSAGMGRLWEKYVQLIRGAHRIEGAGVAD